MLHDAPAIPLDLAERFARELFGVFGTASALPSERDQNVLIEAGDAYTCHRIVLKLANAGEDRALLEAQQRVLAHLAERDVSGIFGSAAITPRVVPALDGTTLTSVDAPDGKQHFAWAVTWLPGTPLALARRRSPQLYEDLGRQTGALDCALASVDHPALHRDFYWDLANGRDVVRRGQALVSDAVSVAAIDRLMAEFDRRTAPLLDGLPRQTIHNDLNNYNVLIGGAGHDAADVDGRGQRVTGIVDFGDMVYGYRVGDLAIAMAYALLGAPDPADPLATAAQMLRGYRDHVTLTDAELAALFGLVALRLCTSVCVAAEQMQERPDNAYLGISQLAIARILPVLADFPFGLAEAVFREAAGGPLTGRSTPAGNAAARDTAARERPIVPASERVGRFLARQSSFAPVLGVDLTQEPSLALDLSVSSPLLSGNEYENDEPRLTPKIFGAMRDAGVRVAIGRYDEPRLLYVSPAFALGPKLTDEHRTIHIGLDLFAPASTPVYAPLAGTVHAVADNAAPQDYGPVIVLRHETDDGTEFFTLYGHLSRESLPPLRVGARVVVGEQIATLGAPDVNGGWTPHLHLQIITDLLGLGTDFPGVARPSQRAVWCALCPDPNLIVRVPADLFPNTQSLKHQTLAARRARIGGNLSIAYRDPIKVVRGWMQYLYDDEGRRFVDAYNNVPHVGHCHPRVVEAASAQMRVLNTNTRYLNDLLAAYAERLLATLPSSLSVCYFVNSASEANELALRLARAFTGQRDMIVLDAAYHGHTTSLIDLSPYKHAGPGGGGAPEWVHVAPLPDDYRGPFKRGDSQAGAKYAAHVGEIADRLRRSGRGLAGFIAETCPSVGGQIVLPPGYLSNVYEHVRNAGGVCIADEVQTGLGRMGTSFWAFQDHDVAPDIVVMGKPLGNGHPIGVVATTRAIADAFDNGMEFFSTFGGNTVSCAVGLAVLDVLRDEQLQAHARAVGDALLAGLRPLIDRFPVVGDVRGSGLFLGMELVRDPETLEPAAVEASFVANRLRERGILLGTDGPYHNVIKIRPPMPFDSGDAVLLLAALEETLEELGAAG